MPTERGKRLLAAPRVRVPTGYGWECGPSGREAAKSAWGDAPTGPHEGGGGRHAAIWRVHPATDPGHRIDRPRELRGVQGTGPVERDLLFHRVL